MSDSDGPEQDGKISFSFRLTGFWAIVAIIALAAGFVGFSAYKFSRMCDSLDGAKAAIEFWAEARQMRSLARTLKETDPRTLSNEEGRRLVRQLKVQVSALTCGPNLFGGIDCKATYLIDGQPEPAGTRDHYYRLDYSLLGGWQGASAIETRGLFYPFSLRRCSWLPAS